MANARIGRTRPINTNLSEYGGAKPILTRRYVVDGTIEGGQPAMLHTDFLTWKQCTATGVFCGILRFTMGDANYSWGTTTPAWSTAYPATTGAKGIEAIIHGPCFAQADMDKWSDGISVGAICSVNATGLVGGTATNTHRQIGFLLDELAGNSGSDGDPLEMFVMPMPPWEDGP